MSVKITTEEFVRRAKELLPEYDYSKIEYITSHIKVEIICKRHGSFFVKPNSVLSMKSGCKKCGHEKTAIKKTGQFTEKRPDIRDRRFGHLLVIEKVDSWNGSLFRPSRSGKWLCYCDCGNYVKVGRSNLLSGKYKSCGCAKWENIEVRRINRVGERFGTLVCIDNLQGGTKRLWRCDCGKILKISHGIVATRQKSCGCKRGLISIKTNENKNSIVKNFGDLYDLSVLDDYTILKQKDKVFLNCPIHGQFKKSVYKLINCCGAACPVCGKFGWRRSKFINACKNKEAHLYLINCYNENESFYKIGLTTRSVKARFSKFEYNYDIIHIFSSKLAGVVFDLERSIEVKLKKYKYEPIIKFAGHTECYKFNSPCMAIDAISTEFEKLVLSARTSISATFDYIDK